MVLGDEVRRRKNAEATVRELNQRIQKSCFAITPEKQIMKIFHIVVDIHKQITAVSKGLEKPTKQTQQNQWPDLPDPAVSKGVGSETTEALRATIASNKPTCANAWNSDGSKLICLHYRLFPASAFCISGYGPDQGFLESPRPFEP